jgi:hypothetical protein
LLVLACATTATSLDAVASSYSQSFVRALSALLAAAQGTSVSSWQQVRSAGDGLAWAICSLLNLNLHLLLTW